MSRDVTLQRQMKKKTKGLSTYNSIKVLKIIQYTQTVRMLVSYPSEKQATINHRILLLNRTVPSCSA